MKFKPALLIIDMQKDFLEQEISFSPNIKSVCEHINYVASLFRERSLPVFNIYDHESAAPGDAGFEFVEELNIDSNDEKIYKVHGNSFRETELEKKLKELEVNFVIVTGFKAEACVLATIHGAIDRDISFAILRDGITSTSTNGAKFVEENFPILSYSVLEAMLN